MTTRFPQQPSASTRNTSSTEEHLFHLSKQDSGTVATEDNSSSTTLTLENSNSKISMVQDNPAVAADDSGELKVYKTGERGCFLDFETQAAAIARKRGNKPGMSSKLKERAAIFSKNTGFGGSIENNPHSYEAHVVPGKNKKADGSSRPPLRRINSTGSVDTDDEELPGGRRSATRPLRRNSFGGNKSSDDEDDFDDEVDNPQQTTSRFATVKVSNHKLAPSNNKAAGSESPKRSGSLLAKRMTAFSTKASDDSDSGDSDSDEEEEYVVEEEVIEETDSEDEEEGQDKVSPTTQYLKQTKQQQQQSNLPRNSGHSTSTNSYATFFGDDNMSMASSVNHHHKKPKLPPSTTSSTLDVEPASPRGRIKAYQPPAILSACLTGGEESDEEPVEARPKLSLKALAPFSKAASSSNDGGSPKGSPKHHHHPPKGTKPPRRTARRRKSIDDSNVNYSSDDGSVGEHEPAAIARKHWQERQSGHESCSDGEAGQSDDGGNDTEDEYTGGGGYRGTFMDFGAQQRAIGRRRQRKPTSESRAHMEDHGRVGSARNLFEQAKKPKAPVPETARGAPLRSSLGDTKGKISSARNIFEKAPATKAASPRVVNRAVSASRARLEETGGAGAARSVFELPKKADSAKTTNVFKNSPRPGSIKAHDKVDAARSMFENNKNPTRPMPVNSPLARKKVANPSGSSPKPPLSKKVVEPTTESATAPPPPSSKPPVSTDEEADDNKHNDARGGNDTEDEYEGGGGYRGTFMDFDAQQRAISRKRSGIRKADFHKEKQASPAATLPTSPSQVREQQKKAQQKQKHSQKDRDTTEARGGGGNDTEDEYEGGGGYRGTFMDFEAQQRAIGRQRSRRRGLGGD